MKILDYIINQRKGHYCHALELDSIYSLECVIESFIMELGEQFSLQDYLEFFNSISLYYYYDADSDDEEYRLTEEQQEIAEDELYNADIGELVRSIYDGL